MPPLALPFPAFDPVLIQIGPLAIRWYALAYIVGILGGWVYARALIRAERLWNGKAALTVVDFDDFILWVTLGIILGGRLGYVLFYNPSYFVAHPSEIIQLWKGGMSFHGGFLGCVIAVIGFARWRGISILSLGDIVCAVAPIGLFLGRIANFINAELWGRTTDVAWAFVFPGAGPLPRHPSQLYEAALEGVLLSIILWWYTARPRPRMAPAGLFLIIYSLSRITVEFWRVPDQHLNYLLHTSWVTMGIILSLPMLLVGLALVFMAYRRREPSGNFAAAPQPA
jgi:phosphatidylglycerol---prolipoprotein diacylglyceryl transferase